MSVELLLLAVLCGLTLIAYMVAINAHGIPRLIFSYLIATLMLAGTVWVIIKYVNTDLEAKKTAEFKRLQMEKMLAEEKMQSQEQSFKQDKERMSTVTKLTSFIATGSEYATQIQNVDLQDKNEDLEALMKKAQELKKKSEALQKSYNDCSLTDSSFASTSAIMKNAMKSLTEAAFYFNSYYYSEDSDQERLREQMLRQKANSAYNSFKKASALLTPTEAKN
jgi:hypothetical protein